MVLAGGMSWFGSDDEFVGKNPDESAGINYWLKRRHLFGDLKIEVYDAEGELITTLPGKKRRGINRVGWPMRLKAPTLPPANALVFAFAGPRVPEGSYTFKLIKGKEILEGNIELVADPRNPHPKKDRLLQQETGLKVYDLLGELTFLTDSVTGLRDQARERARQLSKRGQASLEAFADSLDKLHQSLVVAGEGGLMSGREQLRERMGNLFGELTAYDGRPSGSQLERVDSLAAELSGKQAELDRLAEQIERLNRTLVKRGLTPLEHLTHEAWQAQQEGAGSGSALIGLSVTQGLLLGL
jgi:hypothetical protein